MDFDKILAQASSNAVANRREMKRADRQLESEKRRSMEQFAQRKRAEKEDLRRRLPPKPVPPLEPKFVIPKKAQNQLAVVDKNKLNAFLQRQEQEKRDQLKQKQLEKEELIRLRIEASGGKANKKIAKHFGKSPLELQRRFAHNSDHEDTLIRQEEREQEEHDRLSDLYRQGVYRALNKKAEVTASHSKNVKAGAAPSNKRLDADQLSSSSSASLYRNGSGGSTKTLSSSSTQARSNFANGSHPPKMNGVTKAPTPELKKRKPAPPPIADFGALMQTAQMNSKVNPDEAFNDFKAPAPPSEVRKKSASRGVGLTAGLNLTYASKRSYRDAHGSPERAEVRPSKTIRKNAPVVASDRSASATKRPNGSKPNGAKLDGLRSSYSDSRCDEMSRSHAPAPKIKAERIIVDPEMGPMREKRYLPGDIRAGKSAPMPNGAAQKRLLPGDIRVKQMAPLQTSSRTPSMAGTSRQPSDVRPTTGAKRPAVKSQPVVDSRCRDAEETEDFESALARKRRELEDMERAYASQRQPAVAQSSGRDRETAHQPRAEQRSRYDDSRYSNSRIPSRKRSRSPAIHYPTYSESDEDEEDEECYDDEYDSDMADFIDDSNVDESHRKDFEESLRIINPHYDKQKWKMREKMISDRHMDARFKDVEMEERHSAKIGFYEDVKEARRGSKALA